MGNEIRGPTVSCPKCGTARPPALAHSSARPPCPKCGERGIAIAVGIATELNISGEVSIGLRPGQQSRDWRRRWTEIQGELSRLDAPRTGELSADGVHAAVRQLQSFYIQSYHLKDALKADALSHGISGQTIESAITSDPDLSLLADLANTDKHFQLTRPPRSGNAPTVDAQGVQSGSGEGGWRLALTISHKGKTQDGLEFARQAVDAWRRHLAGWGLKP